MVRHSLISPKGRNDEPRVSGVSRESRAIRDEAGYAALHVTLIDQVAPNADTAGAKSDHKKSGQSSPGAEVPGSSHKGD